MNKINLVLVFIFVAFFNVNAQKIEFTEYTLDNGLHVILHQDNSAPVVVTSVMYHVGSKNEDPTRTGLAHFFEHLLFEGTKNIERGEWDKLVSANGGDTNANTSDDRTYYYEVFPSNNLDLALWMESERLLQPVINQVGVDTQNEVVKEEKRSRIDNQPYAKFLEYVKRDLFKKHPYKNTVIGTIEHLDAATLEEFKAFNKKFYVPNNATLVIAGDFEEAKAKASVKKYFERIPKGNAIDRNFPKEEPITSEIKVKGYDPNIQIPAIIQAYRTPSMKERDAKILQMIAIYLSTGKSSVLYKKMVDTNKNTIEVGAIDMSLEDYGMYVIYAMPLGDTSLNTLTKAIDEELLKLQTELISEDDYKKLLNVLENQYVNANGTLEGIAESLATYHRLYGNTNLINTELDTYKSITREDIKEVAKKYLNKNQRLLLEYLPKK